MSTVPRTFDVASYGAVGDGYALDTAAFQSAIDACAAAGGGRVVARGTRTYRIGTLALGDRVWLHLDDGATLRASLSAADYSRPALISAAGARGIGVSGPGRIEGRSADFMTGWDEASGIYRPAAWRPRMFELRDCSDVTVSDVTMADAPFWGLHLLGCEHVLVERLVVRNNLEVPNCDGVDIDHCRDVEVRDCSVRTGDDAIVIKATGATRGPVRGVCVHDCELTTQDSALKIGTETTADISGVRFERCIVTSCNRACTIQLRDAGSVHDITFSDISFTSRYFSAPWWGHGEGISVTALPRVPGAPLGRVSGVVLRRIRGDSENSLRLDGSAGSRLSDLLLDDVHVTLGRWTSLPGGVYDNRPAAGPGLVAHDTPGIHVSHADRIRLNNTSVSWGREIPGYFSHALTLTNVTGAELRGFRGGAARPGIAAVREMLGIDRPGLITSWSLWRALSNDFGIPSSCEEERKPWKARPGAPRSARSAWSRRRCWRWASIAEPPRRRRSPPRHGHCPALGRGPATVSTCAGKAPPGTGRRTMLRPLPGRSAGQPRMAATWSSSRQAPTGSRRHWRRRRRCT